jgi:uncharacterized RDD family membrane protein YckC
MNCPACNRNLASTLSVCPSCGTMVFDSVREELALKISPIPKMPMVEETKIALKEKSFAPVPLETNLPVINKSAEVNLPVVNKPLTAEIRVKNTMPTLVEFHNKNATVPEWRLQLQNTVRMRNERNVETFSVQPPPAPRLTNLVTNGATALKAEPFEQIAPMMAVNAIVASNPTLAKAMQRIEASRKKFYVEPIEPEIEVPNKQPSQKSFPYSVVSKSVEISVNENDLDAPKFVPNFKAGEPLIETKAKFDTNKLPPLPNIDSNSNKPAVTITKVDLNLDDDYLPKVHTTFSPEVVANSDHKAVESTDESGEIDDCAPMSLRFNSAIFDLIIGSFASLILLSPFMLLNGRFFTVAGFFAFLATCSIVMFIYLTTTVGLLGKTLGMKLFSLEIVDIEENAYPTFHQAAVSSAIYLLSLAFGGLGFLTLFMNNEKRAAHDLLSGTIIVKEYQA